MKKILLVSFILSFSALSLFAGNKLWSKKMPNDVEWLKVTDIGSVLAATKEKLYCINPQNGEIKWKKEKFNSQLKGSIELYEAPGSGKIFKKMGLKGGHQPIIENDEIIFAFPKPSKINLNDGSVIYNSSIDIDNNSTAPKHGYANWINEKEIIFMPNERRVVAVNKKDGTLKWESEKQKENICEIIEDGEKLILKGINEKDKNKAGFINIINKSDGKNFWKERFKIENATNIINEKDSLIIISDKRFYNIDKTTGKEIIEVKMKKLKELTNYLKQLNSNIYAVGSQSVAKLKKDTGDVEWEKYFEAPGSSGWMKLAAFAASAVLYAAATSQAMSSYQGTSENYSANQARGSAWSAFGAAMSKRYHSTISSGKYVYFLAKLKDGAGIIGVNIETSEANREALLNTKKPNYEVDEIEGRVFNIIDDNTIEGFSF